MIGFFQYLSYILRHKWYVAVECLRRGLLWRALTHDLSKLRPSEFFPYMRFFYTWKDQRERSFVKDGFNQAWLQHIHRNDHHWQHHILYEDEGKALAMPMSRQARTEMLCDWIGAGKAQGHGNDVRAWYVSHKEIIKLHPHTREMLEHDLERSS